MTHHHLKKIKHVHIHRYLTFLSEENFVELNYKAKSIFSGIFLSRYDNYFMSKKYLEEIIDIEGAFIHDFYPFNLLLLQRIYIYTENYKILNGLFYKHVNKINKIKIKGMLFYNFVLSLEVKNKEEEAIKNYKIALKYFKNKNLRDLCNNNIGVCLCKLKKYEESNKIYFELLNSSTKNIDKSRYYSNLLINYIGLNYKISVKNIVYKLDRLLFELNKLNKIKYQSYTCLGKGYLFLNDRFNAMKAFENELMLGIEKRKNHFFFEDYKYCIKELINLYHVNDINKFNFLEKYIDKLPLELLDAEYLIYLVYHYSLVYSRNEMIRFNKKNFSKYLNLSSALHN